MNAPTLFDMGEVHTVLPHDITLGRHRGSQTSIEANPSPLSKELMREKVYKVIAGAGVTTSKEVAAKMGVGINIISGRITELLVLKRIDRLNGKRDGASLLRAR